MATRKVFRWDLFLRDYKAFMFKSIKKQEVLAAEVGVSAATLSGLRTGRTTQCTRTTLDKILKMMNIPYVFYCEVEEIKDEPHQVLSPDGITIEFDHFSYPSKEAAEKALAKWIKRYKFQGYYSSKGQRIPLNKLKFHCQIKPV